MSKISYRSLETKDYDDVKKLISSAFGFNIIKNVKLKNKVLNLYLSECLLSSTFTKVAVCDNRVIGVILGKAKNHSTKLFNFNKRIRVVKDLLKINIINKESREILSYFNAIDKVYRNLLKGKARLFDGSIELFIVSEEYRGLGLGKSLLKQAYSYFSEAEANSIYLYTDTNCNYQFYNYQNFDCIGKQNILFNYKNSEDTIFLYKIDL